MTKFFALHVIIFMLVTVAIGTDIVHAQETWQFPLAAGATIGYLILTLRSLKR